MGGGGGDNLSYMPLRPFRPTSQGGALTRQLAASQEAAYNFQPGIGANWWKQHKYQSGIWKNLNMDKPSTPRRI